MINDALVSCEHRWKYVDDISIAKEVPSGSEESMQADVSALAMWTTDNDMKINGLKSCVMRFFCPASHTPSPILLDDKPLPVVDSAKVLGVIVSNDLKWNKYIHSIVTKASKRLFFLSRLRANQISQTDMLTAYTNYIRPVVEYAAPIWHCGLSTILTKGVERIQKRAVRIILGNHDLTYDEALRRLNLQRLSTHRTELFAIFASSVERNPRTSYLLTQRDDTGYALRRVARYVKPRCRTVRFQRSPLLSIIDFLNSQ